VTLAEIGPLLRPADARVVGHASRVPSKTAEPARHQPPPLAVDAVIRYDAGSTGAAKPGVIVRNRLKVQSTSVGLFREIDEIWSVPADEEGKLRWEDGELLSELPDLVDEPPDEMEFPPAAPGRLAGEIKKAATDFAAWRARKPVMVMVNQVLKMAAGEGEDREAFLERCLAAADQADDTTQERVTKRYESRMKTLRKRLDKEGDELDRDRVQLDSRKAEEKMGMVEGLFSVLLGSRSMSSASRKAAAKLRTAAGKRRMRQTAEGSVVESEREIERLTAEIEGLAEELEGEIERIAAESEALAGRIEEQAFTAKKTDISVLDLWLVWR
jgi:hypothetical protein